VRALSVFLSVFRIGQPRTGPMPPLRNRAIFRPWATVVDGPPDFFKHEDSGDRSDAGAPVVALREGSPQAHSQHSQPRVNRRSLLRAGRRDVSHLPDRRKTTEKCRYFAFEVLPAPIMSILVATIWSLLFL
jgi:hypothetical protein